MGGSRWGAYWLAASEHCWLIEGAYMIGIYPVSPAR